ncbi:MAG: sigma-70 family RNA polymerase sigma factor [Bacteroidota bacterium]
MNAEGTTFPIGGASMSMSATDEKRALVAWQELDSQAIGAIYDRYFKEIYRYVYYRIGDQAAAEDLAGDVFVRLLEATRKKRGPETNVKGWLLATASHIITDHLRRRYRRPVEAISESLADQVPGPSGQLEQRERDRSVQEAYLRLTPEQQDVLALRFGQGFSLEETAVQMRKKVNAVKALQFRARAALQRQIGE